MMERRRVGSSSLSVSPLCLGTMTFGEQNSVEEAAEICNAAFNSGINFFDSAELYPVPRKAATQGNSEVYFGQWLQTKKREDVIVASKVAGHDKDCVWIPANRTVPRGKEAPIRVDAASIIAACDASLRRLQTPYLDLYQIHWPDRYVPAFGSGIYDLAKERASVSFEEQARAMARLIGEGKVRYWGLSNETAYGVAEFDHVCESFDLPRPVSIQNSYSLLHRSYETDMVESCSPRHCNLGLLAWSPLAGGMLTGKYSNDPETWPVNSRFARYPGYMKRFVKPACIQAAEAYSHIAQGLGVTAAQLALAYVLHQPFVSSAVLGVTTVAQLHENIEATGIVLQPSTLAALDKVHRVSRNPQFED